jgi:transposase-like protein
LDKPRRAPRDRNNPQRRKSSESDYSLMEFVKQFPDDAACLDRLWRDRFAPDGHHAHCPRCERERKFHRTKTRASYTCDTCGLHIHPMKGTIFERSSTSLHLWFYAMYLIASTRCGISAKQLERELGVTYKQAHKMFKRIRTELMNDDEPPLSGDVEIDETSWRHYIDHRVINHSEGVYALPHNAKLEGPALFAQVLDRAARPT